MQSSLKGVEVDVEIVFMSCIKGTLYHKDLMHCMTESKTDQRL